MNTPGDFKSQLDDLTARLCVMVAERLEQWTRDTDPSSRYRIINMIEDNLPTIISNAVAKSPSLHSPAGVEYLEKNLDSWADDFAKKFING
jgi:hypothetical protein